MKKFFALIIFFVVVLHAQTDWVRWSGAEISYEIKKQEKKNYAIGNASPGTKFLSGIKNAYYFLISDLDGDNCPFYPSCSNFFVASVKETNLVQGGLMFADRFIRDLNPIKGLNHYPFYSNGKLLDPPENYTLIFNKITYIPGGIVVGDYDSSK